MKTVIRIAGSFLFVIGIAACGGGGGGGGGPTPPPGPPATGTINSGSVLLVSGRAADAALRSGGFGDITNFVGLTSIAAGSSGPRAGESAKPAGWYVQTQVPVGPDTTPCAVGGTVTVSGDIANPLTVTVGDFLDYEWQSCDDGLGQVIDGFIGMTFTEFDGNLLAGQILLGVSLVVQNFQIIEGGVSNIASGDLSLTIDSRTQPMTVVTTQGSSMSLADGFGTDTLTDFLSTVSEDTATFPPNFTTDMTGTIASTLFEVLSPTIPRSTLNRPASVFPMRARC